MFDAFSFPSLSCLELSYGGTDYSFIIKNIYDLNILFCLFTYADIKFKAVGLRTGLHLYEFKDISKKELFNTFHQYMCAPEEIRNLELNNVHVELFDNDWNVYEEYNCDFILAVLNGNVTGEEDKATYSQVLSDFENCKLLLGFAENEYLFSHSRCYLSMLGGVGANDGELAISIFLNDLSGWLITVHDEAEFKLLRNYIYCLCNKLDFEEMKGGVSAPKKKR